MGPIASSISSAPFDGPAVDTSARIVNRQALEPSNIERQALQLLAERYGEGSEEPVQCFARAATGLLGEQTHYSDGFAVLFTLEQGAAVSARRAQASGHRVVFRPEGRIWDGSGDTPYWARLVLQMADGLVEDQGVDIAVVGTISPSCFDAYVSAIGAAAYHCLHAISTGEGKSGTVLAEEQLRQLAGYITNATGMPFSPAYPLAGLTYTPHEIELIDTSTLEHLPIEGEGHRDVAWALVDVGKTTSRRQSFHRERKKMADRAIEVLRQNGFASIRSFRELEHRDLQRAMDLVPDSLEPVVRHLVTENRRVQKLVRAVRKRDWQFFGALLLMSHASLREVWQSTTPELDAVVALAEGKSMEGIYGACMTGRGGCVLVVGRPSTLPAAVQEIQASFELRFGRSPKIMLL